MGPRSLAAFLVAALVLLAVPLGAAVCHEHGFRILAGPRGAHSTHTAHSMRSALTAAVGSAAPQAQAHTVAVAPAHAVPSLRCCDDGPAACHEAAALDSPGRPEARAAGAQVVPVEEPAAWHPAGTVRLAPDAAVFGDGDPPLWLTGCVSRT
jgi:hypothetical protein